MKKKKNFFKILATIFAGAICGFFGGGGGMIAVPLLHFGFDFKQKEAHSTAIVLMLLCSLSAAINYAGFLKDNLNIFWWVLAGGLAGSLIGATLLKKLNSGFIKKIFAMLVIVSGVFMVIRGFK